MKAINFLQTAMIIMVFATVRPQPATLQSEQHNNEVSVLLGQLDDAGKVISKQKAALEEANIKVDRLEAEAFQEQAPAPVEFGGFTFEQQQFNIGLFALCGIFALTAVILMVKFRNANALTVKATESLVNLEEEHQEHLRISLEREQKLRRQLQDELNRHKIANAS